MENVIRLTVPDYYFNVIIKKFFKEIFILVTFLCVFTCSIFESAQYLNITFDLKCSSTCARHINLDKPTLYIEKSLAKATPHFTDSLEIPKISVLPKPNIAKETATASGMVSESAVTNDSKAEPAIDITVPLPNQSSDGTSVPTDEPDTNILYSGFILSESGTLTGCVKAECNLQDGLLILPTNKKCTGIDIGTFDGIEKDIYELFIPSNITYIAPGALDSLQNLMFIQVMDGNPAYYSEKGCLYNASGQLVAKPARKR